MSTENDVARSLRSWLRENRHEDADRVLDAVFDQVLATPQRRASGLARRFPNMSNMIRIGIAAAAAVVVAALIGLQFLGRADVGPSGPTAQPTPSPSPATLLGTSSLDPGTYSIGTWFPVQFDLTITDTWETWNAGNEINRIWKPCAPAACVGYSTILSFEIVDNTFADPCQSVLGAGIGESVDDLVNAVTGLPGFEAGPVTDVSIDGYAGRSFELTFIGPADEACVESNTAQWMSGDDTVYWGAEVLSQRVIILDVDGTRLVVDAVVYDGDATEVDAIIDSVDFH